jgi:hypothetical protein
MGIRVVENGGSTETLRYGLDFYYHHCGFYKETLFRDFFFERVLIGVVWEG